MYELIRNCSHKSKIILYKKESAGRCSLVKSTYSNEDVFFLQNEVDGLEWYDTRRKNTKSSSILLKKFSRSFASIEIDFYKGKHFNYLQGFQTSHNMISKMIDHYIDVWQGAAKPTPVHGDLSVDNFIYDSTTDSMIICDWEHFYKEGVFGFDGVYLLFELIWAHTRHMELSEKDHTFIKNEIYKISSCPDAPKVLREKPFTWCLEFFLQNQNIWGTQVKKMPFNFVNRDITKMMDAIIQN